MTCCKHPAICGVENGHCILRDEWLAAQKQRDPAFRPPLTEAVIAGDLRDRQRLGRRIDRAAAMAQPSRDEAFERRLAEIRAQRAEERQRNRERGRDMGRTR